VRAQAIAPEGELVAGLLLIARPNALHVLNAPARRHGVAGHRAEIAAMAEQGAAGRREKNGRRVDRRKRLSTKCSIRNYGDVFEGLVGQAVRLPLPTPRRASLGRGKAAPLPHRRIRNRICEIVY